MLKKDAELNISVDTLSVFFATGKGNKNELSPFRCELGWEHKRDPSIYQIILEGKIQQLKHSLVELNKANKRSHYNKRKTTLENNGKAQRST